MRFQVSGLRFQVSRGRGQVSGLRSQVSGLRSQRAEGRRGVTLLEVLISIFVMAVGLMGVAALIPIGTFAVSETTKADRSAAMGRAAIHEVRVRDMLEPFRPDGNPRWYTAKSGLPATAWPVQPLYVIGQFVLPETTTPQKGHSVCFAIKFVFHKTEGAAYGGGTRRRGSNKPNRSRLSPKHLNLLTYVHIPILAQAPIAGSSINIFG